MPTPPPGGRARRGLGALTVIVAAVVAGCSASGGHSTSRLTPLTTAAASTTTASPAPAGDELYVSLGDSYAAGYQPAAKGQGSTTRNGFPYQVANLASAKGYHLTLVNFGCGGATVESLRDAIGCRQPGPDAPDYPTTSQLTAALAFLRAHRGRVALVTISIGGNDIVPCALASDPTGCVTGAVARITSDLTPVAQAVREAAGSDAAIIGTTYPDVVLGAYPSGLQMAKDLAPQSVVAFKLLINPALAKAYAAAGATLVDVTEATGAYLPFDQTTTVAPYGAIPLPVAKVCQLTFFCEFQDIHPRTEGYRIIADLVVAALPPKRR